MRGGSKDALRGLQAVVFVAALGLSLPTDALAGYVVDERVSTGPAGGNGAFGASFEATNPSSQEHVFFTTSERLVPADTDSSRDVYDRFQLATTLISTGPAGGNGAFDASFNATSNVGTAVWFTTAERLTSADTDNSIDVYERSGSVTTLVSIGAAACQPGCGNGAFDVTFEDVGVFSTFEQLTPEDSDSSKDVYLRSGDTYLVSTGPTGGNGSFEAISRTGTFFETAERSWLPTRTARSTYTSATWIPPPGTTRPHTSRMDHPFRATVPS
jgi:hypothetical protein